MGHRYVIYPYTLSSQEPEYSVDFYRASTLNYVWASVIRRNCDEVDEEKFEIRTSLTTICDNLEELFGDLSGGFWWQFPDKNPVEENIEYESEHWHVFRSALVHFGAAQYVEVLRSLASLHQKERYDGLCLNLSDKIGLHGDRDLGSIFRSYVAEFDTCIRTLADLNEFRMDAVADHIIGPILGREARTNSSPTGVITWAEIASRGARGFTNEFLFTENESLRLERSEHDCPADI